MSILVIMILSSRHPDDAVICVSTAGAEV